MARPKKQRSSYPELAPYERDLPPLSEFALLAAILGQRESHNAAFVRAVKFYQRAAEFHEAYAKATPKERADLCLDYRVHIGANLSEYSTLVSNPAGFPSSYQDFLQLVVKGRDEAEATARLRHFFQSKAFPTYQSYLAHRNEPPAEHQTCLIFSGIDGAGDKQFLACSTDGKAVSEWFTTRGAVLEWLRRTGRTLYRLPRGSEAGDHIALLKGQGFQTVDEWRYYAHHYTEWWQEQIANQNRENATKKPKNTPAGA